MSNFESRVRLAKDGEAFRRTETLLEAYPDISEEETVDVAAYLKTASALDVGLLSANKVAWDAAEALRKARPDLFRASLRGWLIGLAVIGFSLLLVFWLGHAGMNL